MCTLTKLPIVEFNNLNVARCVPIDTERSYLDKVTRYVSRHQLPCRQVYLQVVCYMYGYKSISNRKYVDMLVY